MIVALGLPLKVATIILGCILSMLLSDFKTFGPISIPTPPTVASNSYTQAGCKRSSLFKQNLEVLNWKFSFSLIGCHIKLNVHSTQQFTHRWGWIIVFIQFSSVLARYEMQTTSSRIWTRTAVSISSDDNYATTSECLKISITLYVYKYKYEDH